MTVIEKIKDILRDDSEVLTDGQRVEGVTELEVEVNGLDILADPVPATDESGQQTETNLATDAGRITEGLVILPDATEPTDDEDTTIMEEVVPAGVTYVTQEELQELITRLGRLERLVSEVDTTTVIDHPQKILW